MAVDRKLFADTVFFGAGVPVFGPETPADKVWYWPGVPQTPHDTAPREHPHRRHRHRRPPPSQVAAAGSETQEAQGAPAAGVRQGGASQSAQPGGSEPREYLRRPPPRAPGSAAGGESESGSAVIAGVAPRNGPATTREPRMRGPGSRHRGEAGRRDEEPRNAGSRERQVRSTGPGVAAGRESDRRERGFRDRSPRGKGPRDRQQGRGRDAPQKRPEQKLYALEAVVDRGFEDVTDAADESTTRRVHWTIIKRTVADQKSGKAMSATYVLQREGAESEFPNLGAARAAVNKTIVHPEKLTLSKAEQGSRTDTATGAWAGRKVLRIAFERPNDAMLHSYAERVIESVIQKGLKPEGMPLLKEAVREEAEQHPHSGRRGRWIGGLGEHGG